MTSTYTRDELNKLALDMFRTVSKRYGRENVVGVGPWRLEITERGPRLIRPYHVKDRNGNWSEDFASHLL